MDITKPISNIFPYPDSIVRTKTYGAYNLLLEGAHYEAFTIQAEKGFTQRYARLRYITCNFAGLVSKVIADILFGEEIQIITENNQEWLEDLYFTNQIQTLNYESSMSNSAKGDALYKIRIENGEIKIDDINPAIYFPHLDPSNPRKKPTVEELAWTEEVSKDKYLLREIHSPGFVTTMCNEVDEKGNIGLNVSIEDYNKLANTNYIDSVETGIKQNLLVHVPNFRYSGHYWGVSDYQDIEGLMFAVNNRMTKTDNILDKHSDPILAVPEGVLDENGQVKKEAFGMIEMKNKDGVKPEYIVWNANLDSAFKEVDKLVEFMFMFSETSPDVLGMGKGQAESGRALKMRLIRTLAKRNRKQLYYDQALREVFYICQLLSKAKGYTVNGSKVKDEPTVPFLKWPDGVINDVVEDTDVEVTKVAAGLISKKRSIMKLEGVEEDEAVAIIEEISQEKKSNVAAFGLPVKPAAVDTKVNDQANSNNTIDKDKQVKDKKQFEK